MKPQPPEPAAATEPVAITFLTYDGTKTPEGDYVRQLQVDAFNAANPDVVVTLDLQSENNSVEFLTKLDLLSLSGGGYDVVALPSYNAYARARHSGHLRPHRRPDRSRRRRLSDHYAYTADVDGVNYGLPYNPSIYYVILNKDMLDAAGLPVPALDWTWADYADYAAALTSGEGATKTYGSYMHTWTEYRREALFSTKIDNPYQKDDGTSNLADPVFKEWLQYVADLEAAGSQIPYADAKATSMAYRDVFFSGKAGMVYTGSWIAADVVNTESFPHEFTTAFAMMPRWGDAPAGRTAGSATYNAINVNSDNQEAAFRFMKYLTGEGATLVNEFSAMVGADNSATIDAIVTGNEALFDKESMAAVWNNPELAPNSITKFPETFAALEDMYNVETEKFMVGGQDLDTTIANVIEQAERSSPSKPKS